MTFSTRHLVHLVVDIRLHSIFFKGEDSVIPRMPYMQILKHDLRISAILSQSILASPALAFRTDKRPNYKPGQPTGPGACAASQVAQVPFSGSPRTIPSAETGQRTGGLASESAAIKKQLGLHHGAYVAPCSARRSAYVLQPITIHCTGRAVFTPTAPIFHLLDLLRTHHLHCACDYAMVMQQPPPS